MITWFTLYLTDNGPNGTQDTAAFDGPTNMQPPDCSSAGPFQQNLSYGQVMIVDGPSEIGTVSGNGTNNMGSGYTRTFAFDAGRNSAGNVTGTFSISESPSGFSLAGSVVCLDIRGEHAMIVGRGPNTFGGGPYLYATIFIDDGGPAGAGDLMYVSAYGQIEPIACLAAQEGPGQPLASGDVDVNAGVEPTPSPTPTPTPDTDSDSHAYTDSDSRRLHRRRLPPLHRLRHRPRPRPRPRLRRPHPHPRRRPPRHPLPPRRRRADPQ